MCEGREDLSQVLYGQASPGQGDAQSTESRGWWLRWLANEETMLAITVGVLIANLAARSPIFSLSLAVVSLILLIVVNGKPLSALRRFVVPSYLTVVAFATHLFLIGETPLLSLGPLVAYREGLAQGTLVSSKIIAGAGIVLLFSAAIRSPRVLSFVQPASKGFSPWQTLAARLRVPSIVIEIAALTYRYLFLLAEEAERIHDAQACRLGHLTWRARLDSFSTLSGMVVIRSYERAERVNEAMILRGGGNAVAMVAGLTREDLVNLTIAAAVVVPLLWVGQAL
ncbi:MAG: hypothetical protein HYY30_12710 [Chloroflexi bacterium]|nr:hypothetical protein [Chloroflexota bacterium]